MCTRRSPFTANRQSGFVIAAAARLGQNARTLIDKALSMKRPAALLAICLAAASAYRLQRNVPQQDIVVRQINGRKSTNANFAFDRKPTNPSRRLVLFGILFLAHSLRRRNISRSLLKELENRIEPRVIEIEWVERMRKFARSYLLTKQFGLPRNLFVRTALVRRWAVGNCHKRIANRPWFAKDVRVDEFV